jgi:S1-C subfamily serine protease/predicted esterase
MAEEPAQTGPAGRPHEEAGREEVTTAAGEPPAAFPHSPPADEEFRMPRALLLAAFAVCGLTPPAPAQDANDATEKAMKAAAAKVAPYIVKIETAGGRETVGGGGGGPGGPPAIRKGVGPTSGLIVDKDGYVITSSFNFANKPSDIFVTVPGRDRKVAKVVANDTSRMLTLLKVDFTDLPVPEGFPKADVRIGQWALAMGRALDPEVTKVPGFSRGIVSATNRIWGKAIQTDAKVSPVNYGGPLVAVDGRVIGVLVPASPDGEGDTAGVEWYDSGIGFAIPFEDVLAVVPRLKGGKDVGRGVLGFNPKDPMEQYNVPVTLGSLASDSAAIKIGLKVGDVIKSIDGKPIPHYSSLRHTLGPKYEGDAIDLVIERDGKEMTFDKVVLGSANTAFAQPFFGILPMRDDPELGVEIRYVYTGSPAEIAGLKAGDRIMKVGPAGGPGGAAAPLTPVAGGRTQFGQLVRAFPVGLDVQVVVKRKESGKEETVKLKIGALTEELPEKLPMPSTVGKALEKPKAAPAAGANPKPAPGPAAPAAPAAPPAADEVEKGLIVDQVNKTSGREYWMYVPDNYDQNKSYGVIVWLHAVGKGGRDAKDMKKIWEDYCDSANFIVIGPKSKKNEWAASETEEVVQAINAALKPYTIDRTRIVAHGMGLGGQMGLYMAFNARDLIRAAAVSGAALPGPAKDNLPNQPLSFFLIAGDKDPLLKEIKDTVDKVKAKKFPAIYRELKDFGKEYIDQKTLDELTVWLDSLDRI